MIDRSISDVSSDEDDLFKKKCDINFNSENELNTAFVL